MAISCIFGFHKWNRCKCMICGNIRDGNQYWNKDCEICAICGAIRQNIHKWNGCMCQVCGKTRDEGHDWKKDCERCTICSTYRNNPSKLDECKCESCEENKPFYDACKKGLIDEVKLLTDKVGYIDFIDNSGRTPLCRDATTVLRTRLYPVNKAPVWAKTDIDAFRISEYAEIAHSCGKFAFMHSAGNITEIIPDLNEAMIDVLNSQLFCMSIEDPGRKFRGKITFWGKIDRQNILPNGTKPDIENAVKRVYDNLWSDCAVTGQCEFGPAEKSENIFYVFEVWNKII